MLIENNLPTLLQGGEMELIVFLCGTCLQALGLGIVLGILTRVIEEIYNAHRN